VFIKFLKSCDLYGLSFQLCKAKCDLGLRILRLRPGFRDQQKIGFKELSKMSPITRSCQSCLLPVSNSGGLTSVTVQLWRAFHWISHIQHSVEPCPSDRALSSCWCLDLSFGNEASARLSHHLHILSANIHADSCTIFSLADDGSLYPGKIYCFNRVL
jgi:hypothetical protein